jgi:type I restriction-modification system DNA methylase subunit
MRCLFTMFAEDTELLPSGSFAALLQKSVDDPAHFALRLKTLWSQMEKGEEFSHVIEARVRHFNGGLFKDTTVFELGPEEIGELLAAAKAEWKQVDPAIFGTLLEQALSKKERKRLGAHYTPRAYVERLVEVTVMDPLRADWQAALTKAQSAKDAGDDREALAIVRAFHHRLCTTRVLDPACGTGNFLYVSLELMKKLEGEVLQTLADLGDTQENLALRGETVDPHQFLGLELNPRAAAIAELVIWIGYLQWHYRNSKAHPNEPILRAFDNINFGEHAGYDSVLTWDGYPMPTVT